MEKFLCDIYIIDVDIINPNIETNKPTTSASIRRVIYILQI